MKPQQHDDLLQLFDLGGTFIVRGRRARTDSLEVSAKGG